MKILLLLLPLFGIAQKETYVVHFHQGRISLSVPKELRNMTDSMLKKRFPGIKQRPDLALSNENGKVCILATQIDTYATEETLSSVKDEWISLMKEGDPSLQGLWDGIKKINGRSVGYWKCISNKRNLHAYNYFFFAVLDGKIYLLNFNCELSLEKTWGKKAEAIVASLVIK